MTTRKLLFLGTGASMGTPVLTCRCSVCLSTDPRNQRLRPSALLKIDGKNFLIDAGPDFRAQALKYHIDGLQGVLLTHTHFDHTGGLDELRVFYFFHQHRLPCLLSSESLEEIKKRYPYFFHTHTDGAGSGGRFNFQVLQGDFGETLFEEITWQHMSFVQQGMKVTGFRLGSFAYVLDIKSFDERIYSALKGVKTLVLSALRETPSPAHFTVQEAAAFAEKVGASQTYLSHLGHELDHTLIAPNLPPNVSLAYDGLEIEV